MGVLMYSKNIIFYNKINKTNNSNKQTKKLSTKQTKLKLKKTTQREDNSSFKILRVLFNVISFLLGGGGGVGVAS